MKRPLPVFILLLAAGLLAGCKSEKERIAETAYGYVIATGNYQIDEAMPYASKETRENTLPFLKHFLLPLTDTNYLKTNTPATATIDTVMIEGDTAWAAYTKTTPLGTTYGLLPLVKEEGTWLVYVPLLPGLIKGQDGTTTDSSANTVATLSKATSDKE